MGISERKEKEKQIRRNDIIDAAEKVIFLKGYDSATIDDIAREAEFSKRTVYIYFNSKEQIYFEIMVRGYKILIEMVETSLGKADSKDSLSRIKEIGNAIYAFNKEYPDYFKAIMSYENGEKDFVNGVPDESREECYALGEKLLCYLVSELEKGKKEETVRRDIDVTSTAILLWSFVIGLFNTLTKKRNYVAHYHNRRPDELLKEGFSFLLSSIKNNNRGGKNELE